MLSYINFPEFMFKSRYLSNRKFFIYFVIQIEIENFINSYLKKNYL